MNIGGFLVFVALSEKGRSFCIHRDGSTFYSPCGSPGSDIALARKVDIQSSVEPETLIEYLKRVGADYPKDELDPPVTAERFTVTRLRNGAVLRTEAKFIPLTAPTPEEADRLMRLGFDEYRVIHNFFLIPYMDEANLIRLEWFLRDAGIRLGRHAPPWLRKQVRAKPSENRLSPVFSRFFGY